MICCLLGQVFELVMKLPVRTSISSVAVPGFDTCLQFPAQLPAHTALDGGADGSSIRVLAAHEGAVVKLLASRFCCDRCPAVVPCLKRRKGQEREK